MTKSAERNLVIGLDVGTSKVVATVGEITADNKISIVGVGTQVSHGMDKGGVNDLNLVSESIQRAIDAAEIMADCRISSVYLGISGKHIQCQNENGVVAINNAEVGPDDIENVIHIAKSVPISAERKMLHALPQEYSIDMQEGIKNPLGMSGVRMEARAHIITCSNDMAKNIEKCVERCGLQVDQLIFSALASGYSVLTEDEKELGVAVIDIGGGTMDITIYTNGSLRHSAVITVAGNQVTGDIAKIFRTPISHAEAIKVQYACASSQRASTEDTIEVPSVGGRPARIMSRHTLAEVVEPRFRELFELAMEEIRRSGLEEQIAAGVVLTGGTAKMAYALEIAEEIFQMPARVGSPIGMVGLSDYVNDPSFATAVGLLQYGRTMQVANARKSTESTSANWWNRVTKWFQGEF
ncbi:cell division protein FtsA [Pseudoalteromonas tunicata]|uniref:Cell division protein FtsA n=1 Tax=Pseudoalteromonas tunicata D2 TaxID=87626 RepID=A4C8D1_9GAMM|nr:cell division protein FtsA [Pseudoalteromonas tunicata]ATC93351.1 cell division protein FtsA [Pseudoalteromonas tunicata]AXT32400.1 cell division protein FtsA [Pseudoalteromonas tunicata]EAR28846.1 Cell division protein [Pseudoalteromonas tunicata D2]MDP4983319.1 cell division protein FtsA [Pseudoalteromonas tunicata]MDP5213529.1 cell division protein FtsA [Pseudoalteromonas tunicata]